MSRQTERDAIIRAAQENGIDPSAALAIAERESNFNPNAHSSRTIHGMFQMTGGLRHQYGIGDSNDPYQQAKGWSAFFKDNKAQMASHLGRDVTDAEGYAGHHFGSTRAARMIQMAPNTPVSSVFSPYERSLNPHFDRAGTVGALLGSVTSDIEKRQAKFGKADDAPLDFSSLGTPVDAAPVDATPYYAKAQSGPDLSSASMDFTSQATPVTPAPTTVAAPADQPPQPPQPAVPYYAQAQSGPNLSGIAV